MVVRCNVVAIAVAGFVVIGMVAIGCTAFGIYEIANHDRVFNNDGLGEVLTMLGLYFSVPYAAILIFFVAFAFNLRCRLPTDRVHPAHLIVAFVCVLILVQQAVTDAYLDLLLGRYSLCIVVLDVAVFVSIAYFGLSPISGYLYTTLYSVKMAMQWNNAYTLKDQSFFGPNGQVAMLFLCIPIMQLPLYASVLSHGQTVEERNIVDIFVSNFNLFLSHLLHSLDIISMYLFAFTPPHDTNETISCPTPLRWLILVLLCVGFMSNNCSLLYLFYKRDRNDTEEVGDLPFLPKGFRDAVARAADEEGGGDTARTSLHKRMFQYLLLMLVAVDIPFFVTRIELWSKGYYALDIFIAKNLKDLLDVLMLLMRTEKQRERLALE